MTITEQNILAHEWIGLKVTIRESTDPKIRNISGSVRNETRNTLDIETAGYTVRISKPHNLFAVTLPSGKAVEVDGNTLIHRPEDRVKRGLARW